MAEEPDEVRITLRLPTALRDRLVEEASRSNRSMNGEIIQRLESSVAADDQVEEPRGGYWELPEGMTEDSLTKIIESANRKALALALREAGITRHALTVDGKNPMDSD